VGEEPSGLGMKVQSSRWTKLHGDLLENPRFPPASGQREARPKSLARSLQGINRVPAAFSVMG
jgi:hypothetical protein